MNINESTAAWIETVALGLVSAFLFQTGLLLLLFLVPLQFLMVKRGPNSYVFSGMVAIAGILGTKLVQAVGLEAVDYILLFADVLLPIALVGGLYLMNVSLPVQIRTVYRVLLATALGFVVTLPLVLYMGYAEVLSTAIRQQMALLESMIGGSAAGESAVLFGSAEAQDLVVRLAQDVFFGSYVAGLCMVLCLNWYVGYRIARRYAEYAPDVRRFRLPETLVWPFVLALGAGALTLAVDIGFLKYIVWNSALVLLFLYAIQGFAIARHLLDRFRVSSGFQFLLAVLVVMLLFVPGVNLVILIGLPGLGVSETWISYNRQIEG
jgi:hypothetical protein